MNSSPKKSGIFIKLSLLLLPLVGISWWFLYIESGGNGGIGGGGYNLAMFFYPVTAIAYI